MLLMSYSDFLRRQEILAFEAEKLAKDMKLRARVFVTGDAPPVLRIFMDGIFLDFRLREIRSSFTKRVWVCKVEEVSPKINFLIHSKTEGDWIYALGDVIMNKGERERSDFHKKDFFYVLERSQLKQFKFLLKTMKNKEEKMKQKVITQWFSSSQE